MRSIFLLLLLLTTPFLGAAGDSDLPFSIFKKNGSRPGPSILVIGGIDGDEPGAFHAAATLVTRYQIQSGGLWIIPDLNRDAILKRERGDLNLKFAQVDRKDPQFELVQKTKEKIKNEHIDLLINLHDGSGFYYPERLSSQRGPWRWGQSFVIDQKELDGVFLGQLYDLCVAGSRAVNQEIHNKQEHFHIKNMRTARLDAETPTYHSLTWYALRNNKPALSIESSKSHPVHLRTYYILLALEALMTETGVTFSRDFTLSPAGVRQVIREDGQIDLASGRISFGLNGLKPEIADFPLPQSEAVSVTSKNPLISLQQEEGGYRIHYGNNRLALLRTRVVELDPEPAVVRFEVDGRELEVLPGAQVTVASHVRIPSVTDVRMQVVGLNSDGQLETATRFTWKDLDSRKSLDRKGRKFRLELYRDQLFSGMIVLDFQ